MRAPFIVSDRAVTRYDGQTWHAEEGYDGPDNGSPTRADTAEDAPGRLRYPQRPGLPQNAPDLPQLALASALRAVRDAPVSGLALPAQQSAGSPHRFLAAARNRCGLPADCCAGRASPDTGASRTARSADASAS